MLFANIDLLDSEFQIRKDCFVRVEGKKITAISSAPLQPGAGETVYDGRGKLMIPAFVNAHAHAPMTLLRGWGENLALQDWLNQRIFPFEAKLTDEDIFVGTQLAIAEMLRTGTVSSTEMYFGGDAIARALVESGAKMNLSVAVTCFDDSDLQSLPRQQEAEAVIRRWNGAGEGRLKTDLSLHAEYTTTPKIVRQMAQHAAQTGLNMHVHMSETRRETEECIQRHGKTPVRYFYDLGLFDAHTTAAHGVWLETEDIPLLKEKDVTIASCPASNLKLASGFCKVPELLEQGVRVALGTDGCASNNNLNMMEEMKLFALAPKLKLASGFCKVPELLEQGVRVALGTDGCASNNNLNMMEEMKLFALAPKAAFGDPHHVTARQALYAATAAGAQAQGRWDCGCLKEGGRADLAVLDRSAPWWTPCHDPLASLVYSAQGTDVCLTMADGRVLYQDGEYKTIDIEKVRSQAAAAAARIAAQL